MKRFAAAMLRTTAKYLLGMIRRQLAIPGTISDVDARLNIKPQLSVSFEEISLKGVHGVGDEWASK